MEKLIMYLSIQRRDKLVELDELRDNLKKRRAYIKHIFEFIKKESMEGAKLEVLKKKEQEAKAKI